MPVATFSYCSPRGYAFALVLLAGVSATPGQAQAGPAPLPTSLPRVTATTLMSAVIPTSDLEKSIAFYTRGLGMTATHAPNPREVVLALPGGGSNLMLLKNAEGPGAARLGPSRVILQVPNVKALAARLQAAGYSLKGDVRELAQYHISVAMIEDPDGNSLELIQRGD